MPRITVGHKARDIIREMVDMHEEFRKTNEAMINAETSTDAMALGHDLQLIKNRILGASYRLVNRCTGKES